MTLLGVVHDNIISDIPGTHRLVPKYLPASTKLYNRPWRKAEDAPINVPKCQSQSNVSVWVRN